MPKLQNVTSKEIDDALAMVDDGHMAFQDIADRIEKNYCDSIDEPIRKIKALTSLARDASDLALKIGLKVEMDAVRNEVNELRKKTG